MIAEFDRMVKEKGIQDQVELKGSFCMERCGEGLNWQIDDHPMTSRTVEAAVTEFRDRVVRPILELRAHE
jgi:hypothetical protein